MITIELKNQDYRAIVSAWTALSFQLVNRTDLNDVQRKLYSDIVAQLDEFTDRARAILAKEDKLCTVFSKDE